MAQILHAKSHKLFYHTYYDTTAKRTFEVDFLLSHGNKISPIEVKSADYRKHRSLDEFSEKYSGKIETKYVIHSKDLKRERDICYLPFYMGQFL